MCRAARAPVLLAGAALCWLAGQTAAQLIALRHPEANDHFRWARPSAGQTAAPAARRHSARPGNVIVHFDRQHDIQRLQYVLQDGRLATLYERRPAGRHQAPGQSHGRMQELAPVSVAAAAAGGQAAAGEPPIDHEQTIDILDDKANAIAQLVGGQHVTLELADGHGSQDKLRVLSTIAEDALHEDIQAGRAKLRKTAHSLKHKLGAKLRELPQLIRSKLRAKSSVGKLFVDGPDAGQTAATGGQHQHQAGVVLELGALADKLRQLDERPDAPAPDDNEQSATKELAN